MPEQYEIVIRNETKQGKTPIATSPNIGEQSSVASPITKKTVNKGTSQNALATAVIASNVVKPYVQQALAFGISQVEMQTGSAELQRKLNAYSQISSNALSIVAAGAVGGVVGAIGAAAMLGVSTMIETGINYANINNRKTIEAENLQLAKSRAGLVSNHSRGGVV